MNRADRTFRINEAVSAWLANRAHCIFGQEIGIQTAISLKDRERLAGHSNYTTFMYRPSNWYQYMKVFDMRLDWLAWLRVNDEDQFISVEVKSCAADYKNDTKWHSYMLFCHLFYFAVDKDFPINIIDTSTGAGVLVVDEHGNTSVKKRAKRRKELGDGVYAERLIYLLTRRLYYDNCEFKRLIEQESRCEKKKRENYFYRPMSLNQAIRYANKRGHGESECAADHRQFADWLKELKIFRKDKEHK